MSFVWQFDPDFKAPYRSDSLQESCELAYDYLSALLDEFIARLGEHRQPLDFDEWLIEEHTWADKVELIFPHGFGKYDEDTNHNPDVWPWIITLEQALQDGLVLEYAKVVCQKWRGSFGIEDPVANQLEALHKIFDFFTSYLQLFVVLANADSIEPDFQYPPNLSLYMSPKVTSSSTDF